MILQWPASRPELPKNFGPVWYTPEHHAKLREFLGPASKEIVELGSFVGRSTMNILDLAPNARLWAVDLWHDGVSLENGGGIIGPDFGQVRSQFQANCWDQRERIRMVQEDTIVGMATVDCELRFEDVVDLVYVDADHSTENVILEVRLARSLWPSAQIAGDDVDWSSVQQGLLELERSDGFKFLCGKRVWWEVRDANHSSEVKP